LETGVSRGVTKRMARILRRRGLAAESTANVIALIKNNAQRRFAWRWCVTQHLGVRRRFRVALPKLAREVGVPLAARRALVRNLRAGLRRGT
jgi:hypothetical protein